MLMVPTGVPQQCTTTYRNLTYTGEYVVVEGWVPSLGEPLNGDALFRIVFQESSKKVSVNEIRDSRIAVCVPTSTRSSAKGKLRQEIRAIAETKAVYLTQHDEATELVRRSLEQQEHDLQMRFSEEERRRYQSGHILTAPGPEISPNDVFARNDLQSWLEGLSTRLLQWAYPGLPVDTDRLQTPVTQELLVQVFNSLPRGPGLSKLLSQVGLGLGLSTERDPRRLDPYECQVFILVRDLLSHSQSRLEWREAVRYLSHTNGLPQHLGVFYLLLFIHWERPPVELVLAHGQGLVRKDGTSVRNGRLVSADIPGIRWDGTDLAGALYLERPSEVSWHTALPYTRLLTGTGRLAEEGTKYELTESALGETLAFLGKRVQRVRNAIGNLADSIPSFKAGSHEANTVLDRLGEVSKARGHAELFHIAGRLYEDGRDLTMLEEDLRWLGRMETLTDELPEVIESYNFLSDAAASQGYHELELTRTSLLARFEPGALTERGDSWFVLSAQLQQFKKRYGQEYLQFHSGCYNELAPLMSQLKSAQSKLDAVERLNTIRELGAPLGQHLLEKLNKTLSSIPTCTAVLRLEDLGRTARCPSCRLQFGIPAPIVQLQAFVDEVDETLMTHNRRLSESVIRKIVAGVDDKKVNDFIRIVQASDLSSLANVLDDQLVQFIRRVVS